MTDYIKPNAYIQPEVDTDALLDTWLKDRRGGILESALGWFGVEDPTMQVILSSISPFQGDMEEELASMPAELQDVFKGKILNLMRGSTFAGKGALKSTESFNAGELYESFQSFNPFKWRQMAQYMQEAMPERDLQLLKTGEWEDTIYGTFEEKDLYRGQNIHELVAPFGNELEGYGDLIDYHTKRIKEQYEGYDEQGIEPFMGDLPAMFLGIDDPGDYFDEVDFLPKDFTKFDSDKPVYDISEFFAPTLHDWRIGDKYSGESEKVKAYTKFDRAFLPNVLTELQDLKSGNTKAITLGSGQSFLSRINVESSIDTGNWLTSLGYDEEKGMYYISGVDIWNFNREGEGGYVKYGALGPDLTGIGEGVQMYGRHYLSEEELLNNIIVGDWDNNYKGIKKDGVRISDLINYVDFNTNYDSVWDKQFQNNP
jgi:hypothetical protein